MLKTSANIHTEAQYEKEELKLLSLFSRDHPYDFNAEHLCEFKRIHRSRRFVFEKPHGKVPLSKSMNSLTIGK